MKYREILKTNETNKNSLLVVCVFSVLLLLTLCYFGVAGTHSYINSAGNDQLEFTTYSCDNSNQTVMSHVLTKLEGTTMTEHFRTDNECLIATSTTPPTCYVTYVGNSATALTETCSQYDYTHHCVKTDRKVVNQRYKECTRGTSVESCDVQSNTGCGALESQGYTCDWAKSDIYTCTQYIDYGPADATTISCVYGTSGHGSYKATDYIYVNKTIVGESIDNNYKCPCPGDAWSVYTDNSCVQKIKDKCFFL